jgi:hypothetical protein
MQRSSIIPLASFAIAILLAALVPSSRHVLRAAGDTTNCTVQCTVTGKNTPQEEREGKDSIRDKGKDAVRKALEKGFKKLGLDTTNATLSKLIDDSVSDVFDNNFDGVTVSFISFGLTGINKANNPWIVTGVFNEFTVILLPKDAKPGDQLSNHEAGHKLIADNTVEYAKQKIKALVEQAGCDDAAIRAAFKAGAQAAGDVQNAANKDYDGKTTNGTVGGADGQIPAAEAAWNAAAGN